MGTKSIISLLLRITVAIIFIQTLYFKFTAHPDSVHIFSSLGMEPYGRIGVGIAELITSILLIVPKTKNLGILLSFGVILGAIFSHFLVLGTVVEEDGGVLFLLALIILLASIGLIFLHKRELFTYVKSFVKS